MHVIISIIVYIYEDGYNPFFFYNLSWQITEKKHGIIEFRIVAITTKNHLKSTCISVALLSSEYVL